MGAFLVYMLKSAFCLILLYLLYRLSISKETFHRLNRFALLGILAVSLIVPLIQLTVEKPTEVHHTISSIEELILLYGSSEFLSGEFVEQPTNAFTPLHWALLIYLLGMLFFTGRHIYSFIRMFLLLKRGKVERLDKHTRLIIHDREVPPFSWFRYIVISTKDLEESGREILIHEKAHIQHRHSLDLLIADVFIFFQWFNPAAWLIKQEMQNIHEYEADETVIKEGVNAKEYQLLLIKKAVGKRLYSMANSFNHSKLKKRITMMSKQKSSKWAYLKYAGILPVIAISVITFARPEVSAELKNLSETKVSDLTEVILPTTPQKTEEMVEVEVAEVPQNKVKEASSTTELVTALNSPIEEAVLPATTTQDTLKKESFKLSKTHPAVIATHHNYYPSKTSNYEISGFSSEDSPLIIIDGDEVSVNILNAIDIDNIESFSILKDKAATDVYGEKGKNGVILVTLKDGKGNESKNKGSNSKEELEEKGFDEYTILLDGKEITKEELNRLTTGEIQQFKVTKGKVDSKEKVLEITTKKKSNENTALPGITNNSDLEDSEIYVDGEKVSTTDFDRDKLNIKSVTIMKLHNVDFQKQKIFIRTVEGMNAPIVHVKGIIVNASGKPASEAKISIVGNDSFIANKKGRFSLSTPKGSVLHFSDKSSGNIYMKAEEKMHVVLGIK